MGRAGFLVQFVGVQTGGLAELDRHHSPPVPSFVFLLDVYSLTKDPLLCDVFQLKEEVGSVTFQSHTAHRGRQRGGHE